MNVPRSVTLPIVIAVNLLTAVVAFLTSFASLAAFHRYHQLAEQRAQQQFFPVFSAAFEKIVPAAALLPLLAIGFGIVLLRRAECRLVVLVWYCSAAAIIVGFWIAATFLAVHAMYVGFHYYL